MIGNMKVSRHPAAVGARIAPPRSIALPTIPLTRMKTALFRPFSPQHTPVFQIGSFINTTTTSFPLFHTATGTESTSQSSTHIRAGFIWDLNNNGVSPKRTLFTSGMTDSTVSLHGPLLITTSPIIATTMAGELSIQCACRGAGDG